MYSREWERGGEKDAEDHGGKEQAHSRVPNDAAVSRCRTRSAELAAVVEKDNDSVYDGQGWSGKFNETANRFSHGAAGRGQKQSEVRRKLVPGNEAGLGPPEGVTEERDREKRTLLGYP